MDRRGGFELPLEIASGLMPAEALAHELLYVGHASMASPR